MKRAIPVAAAVILATASGCRLAYGLGRDPSPEHVTLVLLLGAAALVGGALLERLFERILPASMKTGRARWTTLALISLLTLAAAAYWSAAAP